MAAKIQSINLTFGFRFGIQSCLGVLVDRLVVCWAIHPAYALRWVLGWPRRAWATKPHSSPSAKAVTSRSRHSRSKVSNQRVFADIKPLPIRIWTVTNGHSPCDSNDCAACGVALKTNRIGAARKVSSGGVLVDQCDRCLEVAWLG